MSQGQLTTLTPPLLITKGKQKKVKEKNVGFQQSLKVFILPALTSSISPPSHSSPLKGLLLNLITFCKSLHWHPNERVESGRKVANVGFHLYSDGDAESYYYDGGEEYGKYSEYSSQYNLYQGRGLKMQVTIVPGLT